MSSTPIPSTSIAALTNVLHTHPHLVQNIRASLECTSNLPTFAVLDLNIKTVPSSTNKVGSLRGYLMEALYNWGFYLTNGFFPYVDPDEDEAMTNVRLSRMSGFESALKAVMLEYLERNNMMDRKLGEVTPLILPLTMMAVDPKYDHLPSPAHFLPVLFKNGRIPAYPPDCEIMAMAMNRMLIVRTSTKALDRTHRKAGAAMGLSESDLLFPNQSFSANPTSPSNPKPDIFKHATLQHGGTLSAEDLQQSQLSDIEPAFETRLEDSKCLRFRLQKGPKEEQCFLVTKFDPYSFPFPRDIEPNSERNSHTIVNMQNIECDHAKRQVKVTYRDNRVNTYTVPAEEYCGDMIDYMNKTYLNKGFKITEVQQINHIPNGASLKQDIPYIFCDTLQNGVFRVDTTSSYQHLAQTGAGNASASIADMVF